MTTTDIDNNSTRVEKNMLGQEVKTIDPKKNESSAKYDDFGRQTEVKSRIDGGDSIKSYIYDNNGNVIKESITSNKPGETVTYRNVYYEYDNMNRLVKTYTDEPGETLYEYDGNGNITKMTTGAVNGEGGVSTTYEYDSQNRLISSTDPMGYSESYTYDNNGNIVSKTDKNGTVTTNVYNGINNPLSATSERDGETETITYTYADTSTALLSIANEAATITYSYDRKGQVTGESRTTGETLSYSYDKDGNQTGLILNSTNGVSQNISYSYDYLGKMKEVRDNLENELVAVYSYDENENLTEKKTNGNTMVTSYEYNESNLPKKVSNQTLADPLQNIKGTYSEYNYSYYLDGNQSSVTDIFGKTKGYTYDSAGRLKTEVNELNKKSNEDEKITTIYSYDERGNRISKEQTKDEVSLMIWTGPRPAYEEGEGYTQYYYDNNNRLTGSSYDYEEYMTLFSVVFQDFCVFSFPLGQNVTTSLEYDEQKVWRCLEQAGFAERAEKMPKGLDTALYKDFEEDGVEISGGEAQKIALARALYKDAPFIVLDEPTAALDPVSEHEIYERFNQFVGAKTAIYISHRLSSCRFCDQIAVFDHGRLIQTGSHDELLADEQGKYHELWHAQAQYYVSAEECAANNT